MSIYSKIQSLLTAANTKTGESDTTLTDAVQTLIDGYGQGGGGVASGTYTPSSDELGHTFVIGNSTFTHFLLVTTASVTGHGKRAGSLLFGDFENNIGYLIQTNSSGTSTSGLVNFIGVDQYGLAKSGSSVEMTATGSSSSYFAYMLSGITYNWYAW